MNLESKPLRCWVEIDPSALRHNLAAVRAQVGARVKAMAVVKANAYGHDAALAVKALSGDADMFGVANLTEAREVRKWAPETPVLILGPSLPDERAGIVSERFIPILSTLDEARAFHALAGGTPLEAHLMIDTGMGRTGVWESEALALAGELRRLSGLRITGLSSHLPSADEDEDFTKAQLDRFQNIVLQLRGLGFQDALVHIENSAGIIGFPAEAGDLVRAGLMLYGSRADLRFPTQAKASDGMENANYPDSHRACRTTGSVTGAPTSHRAPCASPPSRWGTRMGINAI